jgi:peptidoglycan/LPS O-acetylase OafA/YrhL
LATAVAPQPRISQPIAGRQHHLDGLRGIASLYVVLHHTWLEIWPVGHFPTGWIMTATGWLIWGHFAVSIFIVLSGYCLTLPLVRRGPGTFHTWQFLKRRALRILPPYYLSFLLTAILVVTCIGRKTGTHWDVTLPPTPSSIAHGLLLIPEFGMSINHVYWSIGVECKIYLLFPLLLFCFARFGVLRSTAVVTFASLAVAYAVRHTIYSSASVQYLGLFCFGAAAAYIVNSSQPHWSRLRQSNFWMPCLTAAALASFLLCRKFGFAPQRFLAVDLFVGLAALALLVIAGRSRASWLRHVLEWKPLVFIGAFSYSLYLIHAPLLQVVWQYGIRGRVAEPFPQFAVLTLLGLPVILLCAWAFYLACERPFVPR